MEGGSDPECSYLFVDVPTTNVGLKVSSLVLIVELISLFLLRPGDLQPLWRRGKIGLVC